VTNRSKAAGTAWESAIVKYLEAAGWVYAERRALRGNHDRGDIAGIPGLVIEAKNAKTIELAGWLDEANLEATNDHADLGVVWFKRRNRPWPGDGYVLMDGRTFTRLLTAAGYGGNT
jgi:hypothetical protein